MRISNRSVPYTQFLWNVVYSVLEDFLYGVSLKVENGVEVPSSGMKFIITTEEYYQTDNPIGLYESKLKSMIVNIIGRLFVEFVSNLENVVEKIDHSFDTKQEDTIVIDCSRISKKLYGKKLIITSKKEDNIIFLIDPNNTYTTLEDYDEESGEYSTAVFLKGEFRIKPSSIKNIKYSTI